MVPMVPIVGTRVYVWSLECMYGPYSGNMSVWLIGGGFSSVFQPFKAMDFLFGESFGLFDSLKLLVGFRK